MRILRFDSIGGASGDMILGALAGLGADLGKIKSSLDSMSPGNFSFKTEDVLEFGISGRRLSVRLEDNPDAPHRHLADIVSMIENSQMTPRAARLAKKTFERLADAEARVHACGRDQVHFHEVGALDSIVDIAGACMGLDLLEIDGVSTPPLPIGRGSTECAHGLMPVPVPATIELLKGRQIVETDEPCEMVTPTGAALMTTWQDELPAPGPGPALAVAASANSFGHRQMTSRPNLLRAVIMTSDEEDGFACDMCLVMECNIDDTVPELLGAIYNRLLEEGALDVFITPVQMKKNRPGALLTVLCPPAKRSDILDAIFRETTTFGVREYLTKRTMLGRRQQTVNTTYGEIRCKLGILRGSTVTYAPEYEDCATRAAEHGVPVRAVYEEAIRSMPSDT